jgi:hypothetical protein
MVIQLREDAVPCYVNGARPILFGDGADVKNLLDNIVTEKVIVPVSVPSDWVAPLVVTRGANAKIRLCVDFTFTGRAIRTLVNWTWWRTSALERSWNFRYTT